VFQVLHLLTTTDGGGGDSDSAAAGGDALSSATSVGGEAILPIGAPLLSLARSVFRRTGDAR